MTTFSLTQTAFFGRSFSEYALMFALNAEDLRGQRILDCAAGPSSFTAQAHRQGLDVVAMDRLYSLSPEALSLRAEADFKAIFDKVRRTPELFRRGTFDSIDQAEADRLQALRGFLGDYYAGIAQGRYRYASLPELPAPDRAFDLVLCAHLLFVYDKLFDLDFHLKSLLELCRVSKNEVRIHPIVDLSGKPSAMLKPIMEALTLRGFHCERREVNHLFFAGSNETLFIKRS